MAPFCSLCGSKNEADLGAAIGICTDADACRRRQALLKPAKAAYAVWQSVQEAAGWDALSPIGQERWRRIAEAAISAGRSDIARINQELSAASDIDLKHALILLGPEKRDRLRALLIGARP